MDTINNKHMNIYHKPPISSLTISTLIATTEINITKVKARNCNTNCIYFKNIGYVFNTLILSK